VARDPGDLYEASSDAPELDDMVLLYYLDGFIDAGGAGRLLAAHLLGTLDHQEVAAFDVDALIDYRSRRPTMNFVKDHWESYEAPELAAYLLHDTAGAPFLGLVLAGWVGVTVGLIIGAATCFLGLRAVTRVREIRHGSEL